MNPEVRSIRFRVTKHLRHWKRQRVRLDIADDNEAWLLAEIGIKPESKASKARRRAICDQVIASLGVVLDDIERVVDAAPKKKRSIR